MSRTDKTAPYRVKAMWIPREHHDHRFHDCNLPDAPSADHVRGIVDWRERYRNCYWDTDWNDPIYRCGCGSCGYDNRVANRKRRHTDKALIKSERWESIRPTDYPNWHYCF